MGDGEALRIAVDLLHVPSRVRLVRADPLPTDVSFLLRIAAGDAEAAREAQRLTDRSAVVVRDAAAFFIEQILLAPGVDSYRVLGATPEITGGELRRNMALLVKWLHPDMDSHAQQSIFVNRVTAAWDDLKTPERRAAYDRKRQARDGKKPPHRPNRRRSGGAVARADRGNLHRPGLLRRLLFFLAGTARR